MMTRIETEQAVTRNFGLIKGVVCKTLKKYGAQLCSFDVDDIASNTAMCLLDGRLDKYNHTTEKKLQQWIGFIAMQRCIDYLRALKRNVPLDSNEEGSATDFKNLQHVRALAHESLTPEAAYLDMEFQLERRARLRAAVDSLSPGDQDAFESMANENYTTRAYAQAEGIKESSVHTRRHRIVKRLQLRLDQG